MTLENFLCLLKGLENDDQLIDLCRKKILHGIPYIFQGREDEYYNFRNKISQEFDIDFHEVFITGSAKLGFSPRKRKEFDYDSDIDVAIVSLKLYDKILDIIYNYQMELRRSRTAITERELTMYHQFLEYTAMGWIRPDKLPISFKVHQLKNNWFEFFKSISYGQSEVGNYKVSAGVFKTYKHLEQYIVSDFKQLKNELEV
ncbi:conserved hypothetical protein [Rippkaea orientalis PCC 8801]|uniref:Uncharacterized protein n=1 Tax=Rippkaea orientalis (strain PCC 8801 / RF-1) TaxID=41431 RepID=B7K4W6_RIPO1|nr:hypothetical protein [Rippkaea orientalis]ACK66622.1 conserved hypothetical protein [Rippkaea orientalis PCC 8801]